MGWIFLLLFLALGGYGLFRLFEPFASSQPFLPNSDEEGDDTFTLFPHADPSDSFFWSEDDDLI